MGRAQAEPNDAVEALAAQIAYHRDRYYNDQPEISDAEFDALEDRLRELAPDHPALAEVGAAPPEGAEIAEVSDEEVSELVRAKSADELAQRLEDWSDRQYSHGDVDLHAYKAVYLALEREDAQHPTLRDVLPPRGMEWPKSSHELPMGSLNKVNTEEELRAWVTRCDEMAAELEVEPPSRDLAVTEKLDGISIEVLYDGGRFETAITRGDGVVGERIGPNVRRMKGVPRTIAHEGRVSVRGEIILRKSDVDAFTAFKRRVDPKFERLKSLRNTASGIARTKDVKHLEGCRHLTAMFYDVEGVDGLESESDKLDWLGDQGLESPYFSFGDIDDVVKIHAGYQENERERLDYEIDGLVIRANQLAAFNLLGELNHRPRAAVAFKFGNEMQVSTLRDIQWSTGDSGRITPIAVVDPVFLAGAEVRQASLHNLAKVQTMKIGVGDEVMVSRRNDVIPYVERIVVDSGNEEGPPERCRACETPVERDGEYLVCPNVDCPARRRGRLKTWVKQLGLLEWGERTIETLFDRGLAREPADLYRLDLADITSLDGYGEITAKKLLDPLHEKKKIALPTFIAALGIPSVSRETGKLLVGAGFDTFEKIADADPEALAAIEGLGEIKARKILDGVRGRLDEVGRLKAVGVEPVLPEEGGPLNGLSFCFSGSHSRPRKELVKIVEANGGTVRSGVTKGLDYLVLADPSSTSSKAQKARNLGTEIIDEAAFEEVVKERGGTVE
jgi:DNA ligase (NAD+)